MSKAKKYEVGKIARKHLIETIELLETYGGTIVNTYKNYEIRARRLPHGIELKWGKTGTFFNPEVGTDTFSPTGTLIR